VTRRHRTIAMEGPSRHREEQERERPVA